MKKVLSMFLALIMIVSIIPMTSIEASALTGSEIVAYARQFLGYPYVWGAKGPDSFDCSGFVYYVFNHFGIYIPAYTYTVWNNPTDYGTVIATGNTSNAQPGDLIQWESHVAIYTGNGRCIEALNANYGVTEAIPVNSHTNGLNYKVIRVYGVGSSGGGTTPETCNCSTSYAGNYTVTVGDAYDLYLRPTHGTGPIWLDEIPNGTTLYVTKGDGSWAHTTYNGKEGYVSMAYLTKQTHTCSYTVYYESAHPHKVYKQCSCGNKFYTGENFTVDSCSECIAENTIVMYSSKYSVDLTIGGTESTTIRVWTEGNYYKDCYWSISADTNIVTGAWGQNGDITLTAQGEGSTVLKVNVVESDTNNVVTSAEVEVIVTAKKYAVSYEANGGTGAPTIQIKTHGKALTLSSVVPTRSGYEFFGWSTSSTATSATYSAGGSFTRNANTTLYAVWKQTTNSLTVNSSNNAAISYGGDIAYYTFTPRTGGKYVIYSTADADTRVYLYSSSGTQLASDDDSGEGNNFRLEYNLSEGTTYRFGIKYYSSSTTGTIPFKFGRVYTIRYNANGGTGAPTTQYKDYGTNLVLSDVEPYREGYTFQGWSLIPNALVTDFQPSDTYYDNLDATLYAIWSKNPEIPSTDGDNTYGFHIQEPSRTTIRNRDTIVLHAVTDGELPEGYTVDWDGEGPFSFRWYGGNYYDTYATAEDKGYDTITAILYDADGNELARDSVELYSKSGFFDKIGGFFRMLFGATKTYYN